MTKKEEIRNNPWKILKTAQRHYSNFNIYLLIVAPDKTKSFYLRKEGMIVERNNIKEYRRKETSDLFQELKPFKQIHVLVPKKPEIEMFDSFEEFIDEIIRT